VKLKLLNAADSKSYALSVRDFVQVTLEVTIKHYRIHKLPDGSVFIARRSTFHDLLQLVEHYQGMSVSYKTSAKYLSTNNGQITNAAARLVFRLRRCDHETDVLTILHWLRLTERVNFKLALMVYRIQHGMAPAYLNQLVPVSHLPGRRRLRSSSTLELFVPSYRLTTTGRRSFSVAAAIVRNTLPVHVQSAPFIATFAPTAEDILVSTVISGHHHLTLLT